MRLMDCIQEGRGKVGTEKDFWASADLDGWLGEKIGRRTGLFCVRLHIWEKKVRRFSLFTFWF